MTDSTRHWLRLHLTPGLGRRGLIRLMASFGSPAAALAAAPEAWQERAGIRAAVAQQIPSASDPVLQQAVAALEGCGARIVSLWDPAYPALLRQIHDPPALLYLRGTLPTHEAIQVAVVGARRASSAGRQLTGEICRPLAGEGLVIVSGLARGIDTAAHRAALAAGGRTVGVLGCGIDLVYPPENEALVEGILERGALLSEYPPGTPPLPGHFPGRNRIISGLCRGVLVVEAAAGSGSLITVDFALEQGREVFAVPGPVHSATSGGVNQLLKEGAHLVTEAGDILDILAPDRSHQVSAADDPCSTLEPRARQLFQELSREPLHIDDLTGRSGLTPMEVSTILLDLELQGCVEQLPGMRYIRHRRG
ncbi:DNA-processing protein DprA [Desulfuromonas carbonis]|uniref:DNA-processing protein DprA n=1 Tax=Desulfuromonas sp. DDH964 TaxID=1823759 RepID=UPI00078C2956|nr:DNA-processing protein DprA [Desulfuromonas sp. DDH964]AMV73505.1 DNA protection single-strand-binding protein DprA [Desulfuromonas sp. DDH964]